MFHTEDVKILLPEKLPQENENPLILSLGPGLTMVLPIVLIAVLSPYIYGGNSSKYVAMMLIMSGTCSVSGLLWGIIAFRYRKRKLKQKKAMLEETFLSYLNERRAFLKKCMEENRDYMLSSWPSAAETVEYIAKHIRYPNNMNSKEKVFIRKRQKTEEDFLFIRLAKGEIPFQMRIYIEAEPKEMFPSKETLMARELIDEFRDIFDVPVGINLAFDWSIGINMPSESEFTYEVIMSIIWQLALNTDSEDVKMCFIYNEKNSFQKVLSQAVKFLPHVFLEGKRKRLISGDSSSFQELLPILNRILENENKQFHIVFFVLDDSLIKDEMIFSYFKDEGMAGKISVIYRNAAESLPGNVKLFINENSYPDMEGLPLKKGFEALRYISGNYEYLDGINKEMPTYVDFLRIYNANTILELNIREKWIENRPEQRLRTPVGIGNSDRLIYLDLHEKFHGPHGLVAGTTGSGKSEFLETFLLSLCVSFSPENLNFFMIDYKGGGTGRELKALPHCAGIVSNLSGEMIHRALKAIAYENKRRQELLAKYEISHIDDFNKKRQEGLIDEILPHLILIIDEFAELKKEEPDFMTEVISLAAVGRSLGIHLILSTQKPAGVIDDKIFSNSKTRICLKVQDRQDSMDMLRRPEASYLTLPGQCYMQIGNNEHFELFQTAYCKGKYSEKTSDEEKILFVSPTGERKKLPQTKKEGTTCLAEIAREIARITKEDNHIRARQLWLSPLPDVITDEMLSKKNSEHDDNTYLLGEYDDPGRQIKGLIYINPDITGHVLIVGGPCTGKTFFLLRMFSAAGGRDDFIFIDYDGGELSKYSGRDCVVGILNNKENEDIFFYHLKKIIKERRNYLKGNDSCKETRRIIILIDGIGKFLKSLSELNRETFGDIISECFSLGIVILATASTIQDVSARLFIKFKTVFSFEMNDRYQYSDALRSYHITVFPKKNTAGRCIFKKDEEVLEGQIALPKLMKMKEERKKEIIIPRIDESVDMEGFLMDVENQFAKGRIIRNFLPIGYSLKTGYLRGIDLESENTFIIIGTNKDETGELLEMIKMTYVSFWEEKFGEDDAVFIESISEYVRINGDVCPYKRLVAAIYNPMTDSSLSLTQIVQKLSMKAQGVCFGESLSKQRILDFSDVPYSIMCSKENERQCYLRIENKSSSIRLKLPKRRLREEEDDFA